MRWQGGSRDERARQSGLYCEDPSKIAKWSETRGLETAGQGRHHEAPHEEVMVFLQQTFRMLRVGVAVIVRGRG